MTYYNYLGRPMPESRPETGNVLGSPAGGETVQAPPGDSSVAGNGGGDLLVGTTGDNRFWITHPDDRISDPGGIDTQIGWQSLKAGPGIENLIVHMDFNYAIGNELDNLIVVDGSQWMNGGLGNDVLVGSVDQRTTFMIQPGGGNDVIYNWNPNAQIHFGDYGFASAAQVRAAMTQQGSDVVVRLSDSETLTVRNVTTGSFEDRQFLLPLDTSKLGGLTFHDEFDNLQIVDPNTGSGQWGTNFGGNLKDGWAYSLIGNGEQEAYIDASFYGRGDKQLGVNPFSVDNGVLSITAAPSPDAYASWYMPYTSGMLNTLGTFSQKYGYFEARMATPTADGTWPAFWMVPTPYKPAVEADIFEGLGLTPNVDYRRAWGGDQTQYDNVYRDNPTDFHTYGMLWTGSNVTFYLDNVAVMTGPTPANWTDPMALILNLAVGGWGGNPDASQFPAQLKVDYVRAYALADGSTEVVHKTPDAPAATLKADGAASGQSLVDLVFSATGRAIDTADIAVFTSKPASAPAAGTFALWEDGGAVLGAVSNGSSLSPATVLLVGTASQFTGAGTWLTNGKVVVGYFADNGSGGKDLWSLAFDPAKNTWDRQDHGAAAPGGKVVFVATAAGGFAVSWHAPDGAVMARGYDEYVYGGDDPGWFGPVRTISGDLLGVNAQGQLVAADGAGQQLYHLHSATSTPPSGAPAPYAPPYGEGGSGGTTTPPPSGGGTTTPPSGGGTTTPPPSGGDGGTTTPPPSGGGTTTPPPSGGDSGGGTTPPPSGGDGGGTTPPPSGGGTTTPPPSGGSGGYFTLPTSADSNNWLHGTSGADQLTGGATHDFFDGGAGADTLTGGAGDDLYAIDDSGDVIVETSGAGVDTVLSTAAAYTLSANVENIRLVGSGDQAATGNAGSNLMVGGWNKSTLDGGAGDDILVAGTGANVLTGGAGKDIFQFDATPNLASRITDFTPGEDMLDLRGLYARAGYTGTDPVGDGRLVLRDNGSGGTSVYFDADGSGGGYALLVTDIAGVAPSQLGMGGGTTTPPSGGAGTTTPPPSGGTTTPPPSGGGTTTPPPSGGGTTTPPSGGGTTTPPPSGGDGGTTTPPPSGGGTTTPPPSGGDSGGGTTPPPSGGDGGGTTPPPSGGGTTTPPPSGGSGGYFTLPTSADSNNWLHGTSGADQLTGGATHDFFDGGAGADTLTGGAGDDLYAIDDSGDVIVETSGAGVDTVLSTAAAYTLSANVENIRLVGSGDQAATGNAGSNLMVGGWNKSTLDGGAGDDILVAGTGANVLTGGAGKDIFQFDATPNLASRITDFTPGEDMLDLRGLYARAGYTGTDPVGDGRLVLRDNGSGGTSVYFDADGSGGGYALLVTDIAGVAPSQLGMGGGTTTPPSGGAGTTTPPPSGGTTTPPPSGGGTTTPPPSGGGTTTPPPSSTTLSLVDTEVKKAEGANGTTDFAFTVRRSGDLTGTSSVDYAVSPVAGGQPDTSDYTGALTGRVTFAAGESVQVIHVGVIGDTTAEADEQFFVKVSNVQGGTLTGPSAAVGTILNDDVAPAGSTFSLAEHTLSKTEGTGGTTSFDFTVTRSGDVGQAASVSWAVNPSGSAGVDAADFGTGQGTRLPAGSLDFAAGQTSQVLHLTITGDASVEADESFELSLAGMSGSQVVDGRATAVIVNDDTAPAGGTTTPPPSGGDGGTTTPPPSSGDTTTPPPSGGGTTTPPPSGGDGATTPPPSSGSGLFSLPVSAEANNWIHGGGAADSLTGGAAHDFIDGGAGADTMTGGAGDDTYAVDVAGDVIVEAAGGGVDTVLSTAASYTLATNVENIRLVGSGDQSATGNAGSNRLTGGWNTSTLDGGAGDDILVAGTGANVLTGGAGKDIFQFDVTPNLASRITDFTPGEDMLDLRGLYARAGYTGTDPVGDGRLILSSDGAGGTNLRFDADGTGPGVALLLANLQGVAPSALNLGGGTTPPPSGGSGTTTPPASGGGTTTPPPSGGSTTTTAPSSGGGTTTPPPSGGTGTTSSPPSSGTNTSPTTGGTTTPPPSSDGAGTATPPPSGGGGTTTTPPSGGTSTTPPSSGGSTTTPPPGGSGTTTPPPSSGGETSTPPSSGGSGTTTPPPAGGTGPTAPSSGDSTTTPPPSSGGGTTTPPPSGETGTTPPSSGGSTTTPPPSSGGGTTTPPPSGGDSGSTPPPTSGGTTTPPPSGETGTTPPSSGGSTTAPPPSSGGGTTTPPPSGGDSGSTPPPTSGGTTTPPPSGETGTTPPSSGGTTAPPPSGDGAGATTPPPAGSGTTQPPPSGDTSTPPPHPESAPPSGDTGTTSHPPSSGDTSATPPPSSGDAGSAPSSTGTTPPPSAGTTSPPSDASGTAPPPSGTASPPSSGAPGATDSTPAPHSAETTSPPPPQASATPPPPAETTSASTPPPSSSAAAPVQESATSHAVFASVDLLDFTALAPDAASKPAWEDAPSPSAGFSGDHAALDLSAAITAEMSAQAWALPDHHEMAGPSATEFMF